ncbi:CLUMA_CG000281, isoform A [Clunio marinus]|uniref:CLUMA_CG000281, isoform A n=1 Tax=Clunio marinus TaxID=568069 RepID=A0A1J1HEW9_9DIPT|nr:CLUMA_CG000281, isoform A [Clunio marinus]
MTIKLIKTSRDQLPHHQRNETKSIMRLKFGLKKAPNLWEMSLSQMMVLLVEFKGEVAVKLRKPLFLSGLWKTTNEVLWVFLCVAAIGILNLYYEKQLDLLDMPFFI